MTSTTRKVSQLVIITDYLANYFDFIVFTTVLTEILDWLLVLAVLIG